MSLELAQKLGGEVVNSDVYQMYKGLSIATAKITQDEVSSRSFTSVYSIINHGEIFPSDAKCTSSSAQCL